MECVCEREREKERERTVKQLFPHKNQSSVNYFSCPLILVQIQKAVRRARQIFFFRHKLDNGHDGHGFFRRPVRPTALARSRCRHSTRRGPRPSQDHSNFALEQVVRVMNKTQYRMHRTFTENYVVETTHTTFQALTVHVGLDHGHRFQGHSLSAYPLRQGRVQFAGRLGDPCVRNAHE